MNDQQLYTNFQSHGRGILLLSLLLALAALALVQGNGWHAGFRSAQAVSGYLPAVFWESLTTLGDERMALALLLPFCLRYPRVFWAIVIASLIGALLSRGVKIGLPMQRPAAVLDASEITIIGARLTRHSFPSGHTVSVFAFAAVWLALLGWRALFFVGLAGLVGFSRVAVGAHWPIDVLVGATIGTLSAWAALKLTRRWRWGARQAGHWALVAFVALAALTLPFDGQGYPDSLPWRVAVCLWGLAGFARFYLLPLWRDGWRATSQSLAERWQTETKA